MHNQMVNMRWFGLPLTIHEKLEPAMICVEKRSEKLCQAKSKRYTPAGIGGLRVSNTHRGGEIINHMFGIAIDIDSNKTPAAAAWSRGPITRSAPRTLREVRFLLAGSRRSHGTMHFEFLGDPDRILP